MSNRKARVLCISGDLFVSDALKLVSGEENSFCQSCGSTISLKFNFCPVCGTSIEKPLIEGKENSSHYIPYDPNLEANAPITEERILTVVKAKILKGSFSLLQNKDIITGIISERSGVLKEFHDTEFTAIYGYPVANKEDSKHAMDAAYNLFLKLPKELSNVMSIIVHSNIALVKSELDSTPEQVYMQGPVFNEALEMLKNVPLSSIAANDTLQKNLHSYFEFASLGKHVSETSQTPFDLYKVISKKFSKDFGISTPIMGRSIELKKLEMLWTEIQNGNSAIVAISGEAGIGKSKLVQAFKSSLNPDDVLWFQGYCNHVTQNSSFYTLTDLWLRYNELDLSASDDELVKIAKDTAKQLNIKEEVVLPLLYNLMSMEGRATSKSDVNLIATADLKEKIANSVVHWLHRRSDDKPVVFVIEDLHFADPSTLTLLNHLVRNVEQKRILIILTFRPEYVLSFDKNLKHVSMALNKLTPSEIETFIQHLCNGKEVPQDVLAYIIEKTDGVPLFVEELTRALIETGTLVLESGRYELKGNLKSLTIPTTLRDSLTARLDLLGKAKSIAQLSSVFGRSLSHNYLRILSGYDEGRLQEYLAQLVNAGVLVKNEIQNDVLYMFKHALTQEAAYMSIPKSKRRDYHAEVADMFEKHFSSYALTHPEIIAFHYTQAGFIDQAAHYWLLAGKRATENSAQLEAITHFTKGLELISLLPPGEGRDMRELPLRAAMCIPLMAIYGWGSDEVKKELLKAYDLCQKTSDTVHLIPILRGLQSFYVIRGPLNTSRKYAEQMLAMARQLQDQALTLEAARALGHLLFFQGELETSKKNLERALSIYEPDLHRNNGFIFGIGQNPKIAGLSVLAWNNLVRGYPETGLKQLQEAIAYAKDLNHPFSICYAYGMAASFYQTLKNPAETQKYAGLVREFAADKKFVYWKSWGQIFDAWAQIVSAQKDLDPSQFKLRAKELIQKMEEGLFEYRSSGSEQGVPYQLGMLAQAKGMIGDTEEALRIADEALLNGEKYDIHLYDSTITRIKAEIMSALSGREKETEALFRKSVELAKSIDAKFFEARNFVSYYEFMQGKGREDEILPEMTILYDSFTEGCTIAPDLIALHKFVSEK